MIRSRTAAGSTVKYEAGPRWRSTTGPMATNKERKHENMHFQGKWWVLSPGKYGELRSMQHDTHHFLAKSSSPPSFYTIRTSDWSEFDSFQMTKQHHGNNHCLGRNAKW